jgi:hypothetical protein
MKLKEVAVTMPLRSMSCAFDSSGGMDKVIVRRLVDPSCPRLYFCLPPIVCRIADHPYLLDEDLDRAAEVLAKAFNNGQCHMNQLPIISSSNVK